MRIGRSGKPGRTRLFDAIEDYGTFNTPGSLTTPRPLVAVGSNSTLEGQLWFTLSGTAAPTVNTIQLPSGARLFGRIFQPGLNQTAFAFSPLGMPLGEDLSVFPASARIARRYVWETMFARTFPVVAGHNAELGLLDDAAKMGVGQIGIVMRSISTVYGGNWHSVVNRAGAEIVGADSGVGPTGALQHFKFEYLWSLSPVFNVYIDGTLRASISGIANLPTPGGFAGASNENMCCLISTGAAASPAGQIDWQVGNRFYIEE